MNSKELIEKASNGKIKQSEIKLVYEALVNHSGDEYDLLLILGRSEAKQYRDIVEQYLYSPHDPMLARLALQILCRYWGLASEYKDKLEKFIKKVEWDGEEDVRLMAIGCVADAFKKKPCPKLLSYVYYIYKNVEEDEITRGAAYETLALVSGLSPSELPQPHRFDLNKDIDPSVMKYAEEIILRGSR